MVVNSEEQLHSILAALEECRLGLIESANQETAHLVGLAILEIRMKLNRISDSDLKALCDAMLADQSPAEASQDLKALHRQRWRPVLKVIK